MGGKTDEAAAQFATGRLMQAALVVFDRDKNTYLTIPKEKKSKSGHIEVSLVNMLKSSFRGSLRNVPNNARLIFAVTFSPCQNCTRDVLPALMKDLDAAKRGVQVKFRFEQFWTEKSWLEAKGSKQITDQAFWPDDAHAINAYKQLSIASGSRVISDKAFEPQNEIDEQRLLDSRGAILRTTTNRYNLVISRRDGSKTSFTSDYMI